MTTKELCAARARMVVIGTREGEAVFHAGATMAAMLRENLALLLVTATDAGAGAKWGDWWTASRLRRERRREGAQAMAVLGARRCAQQHWAMAAGSISRSEAIVHARLRRIFLPTDLLLLASGGDDDRAALRASQATGARCLLWTDADDDDALRIPSVAEDLARKRVALASYRTRTRPDPRSDRAPEWSAELVRHVVERGERFVDVGAAAIPDQDRPTVRATL